MKKILASSLLLFVLFAGCGAEDPSITSIDPGSLTPGQGDPVVAIGNSLTAGFINRGIVLQIQLQGYANRVANQYLKDISDAPVTVVPGLPPMAMSMPLVQGGISSTPGKGLLYVTPTGSIAQDDLTGNIADLLLASALLQPYANLGVPGAWAIDTAFRTSALPSDVAPTLPVNPFFEVVLRNSALPFNQGEPVSMLTENGTQLGQFLQIDASFQSSPRLLMLWIGANDILLPAGETGSDAAIPPVAAYQQALAPVVTEVAASDVPMVAIANIPKVTATPAFTTVVGLLQANGMTPADVNTDEDEVALILLQAQPLLFPGGSPNPDYFNPASGVSLGGEFTLTNTELTGVLTRTAEYNAHIASVAADNGWAAVDIEAALDGLPQFPDEPTAPLNATFPLLPTGQNTTSAFGLDGVHPSEKGYAFIANEFIDAINATYADELALYRPGHGLMDPIDLSSVDNLIGFEQFNPPAPRVAEAVR